jgi:phage/plasmid-like protein (TIGR03299 family)
MPALFDQGFFVREPAWHGMGVVLDDYPGRAEAMRLAGHDFRIIERPVLVQGNTSQRVAEGFKGLVRVDTGEEKSASHGSILNITRDTYAVIQNDTAWDIADVLFDQGFQYETGITLDDGRICAITLALNEPITLPGDDSVTVPFGCLSWSHDGSGALRVRSGSIRQVCANTVAASEAEGKNLGTEFTFRHTKNVHERIEDAKLAVRGARKALDIYRTLAEELGRIPVTPEQRDLFVSTIIGDRDGIVSKSATVSERVKDNIETERAKVNSLFFGKTIPVDHVLTGYGLHLAGVEYFDHLRNYRSQDSYVKRTLLTDNPAKASLVKTIREVVAA